MRDCTYKPAPPLQAEEVAQCVPLILLCTVPYVHEVSCIVLSLITKGNLSQTAISPQISTISGQFMEFFFVQMWPDYA